jgi:1,2-phenylacetyl-CoA epoxidase catalytic subunit
MQRPLTATLLKIERQALAGCRLWLFDAYSFSLLEALAVDRFMKLMQAMSRMNIAIMENSVHTLSGLLSARHFRNCHTGILLRKAVEQICI